MEKNAVISVSNKTGLDILVVFLLDKGYNLYSTGGTLKEIYKILGTTNAENVHSVESITNFPEILGGRVKTLHPHIYGGLLSKMSDLSHQQEIKKHGIIQFDLVVVNLYPFQEVVSKGVSEDVAIENIDIGGVSIIRASSKNYNRISLLTSPEQYTDFINKYINNELDNNIRKNWATIGFQTTAKYDTAISEYYQKSNNQSNNQLKLKYGSNPQQSESSLSWSEGDMKPFTVHSGNIGYINVLDFLHGYLIVREIEDIVGIPTAISMKHTSPAGIAIGTPLDDITTLLMDITPETRENLTPMANAFIKSRNCDPLSSFGDFIVCSNQVDVETAKQIKRFVSDGIMASSYSEEALEILKTKKGGKYIIIEANLDYYNKIMKSGWNENKSIYGIELKQRNNEFRLSREMFKDIPENVFHSLVAANTSLKYTQSNNIAIAYDGQVIGIGAGQQNRVDCVRLACKKATRWINRRSEIVKGIFINSKKENSKFQDRINFIYQFLENQEYFIEKTNYPLVLASDGFFPFSDNIIEANKYDVKYIIQPGGSMRDKEVDDACEKYNIKMYKTNNRMFYH